MASSAQRPGTQNVDSIDEVTSGRSHIDVGILLDNHRKSALITLRTLFTSAAAITNGKLNMHLFVQLFNQDSALEELFKLFDRHAAGVIPQENLTVFLKQKLETRNEQSREFAELIDTVTYVITGDLDIDVTNFKDIFKAKSVLNKLFLLIDETHTGAINCEKFMNYISELTLDRKGSELTQENLQQLKSIFQQHMKSHHCIYLEEFKKIFPSKIPFFAERAFKIFDKDGSGSISLHEFMESMEQYCSGCIEDKLRFLFQIYDIDGDGLISKEELSIVLTACMKESAMNFSEQQLEEMSLALFEDANVDPSHGLTYEQLKSQVIKHEGLLDNLVITIDRWLVPSVKDNKTPKLRYTLSKAYVSNNYTFLIFLFLYLGANVALIVTRIIEYKDENTYYIIARLCGQGLNFNCMFILVLMLRRCITFLRVHCMACALPLDDHIFFHKLCGYFIVFYSIVHTLMHIFNFTLNVASNLKIKGIRYSPLEWLFTMKPSTFGLIPGFANPSGWPLLLILALIFLCCLPCVRNSGHFEIFYWTHLLYVPFWIFTILHAPNFWKWFVGPGVIFIIEKLIGFIQRRTKMGQSFITSGVLLPSRVTHLVIKRPNGFHYHPGDYIFVNIPTIAKSEWHPFTISSAPEQTDSIWLHVRGVGGWTNKLYQQFEKEHNKLKSQHGSRNSKPPSLFRSRALREEEPLLKVPRSSSSQSRRNYIPMSIRSGPTTNLDPENPTERNIDNIENHATVQRRRLTNSYRHMRTMPPIVSIVVPSKESETTRTKPLLTPRLSFSPHPKSAKSPCPPENPVQSSHAVQENFAVDSDELVLQPVKIFIDGPYGTPSAHIFEAQHAVLIGTGIGVTPFASILQSIMHRYWKTKQTCPKCDYTWNSGIPESVMKLKKVDFFWINREQRSFEWFVNLLSLLEMEQAEKGGAMERFLEMHMYITSALQKKDMKAVGLQLALDLLYQKEKRDLVTGLKTRTICGRPNWDKVFQKLLDQQKGKVTVFYCGPHQLGKLLGQKCVEFGFNFKQEVF